MKTQDGSPGQIILGLADRKLPVELASTLRGSRSTIYRVAENFSRPRLMAQFDRRSQKWAPLVEQGVPELLCALVPTSPREHGWKHSTWNCELLSLVVNERSGLSKITEKALALFSDRLVLHFLPADSPKQKQIEWLWQHLHACVTCSQNARTIEELMERVYTFLHAASQFPGNRPSLAKAS